VSIDDEATGLDDFKKSTGMTYPVEWDRDHRLANLYRVANEPTVYVVDRTGIVRFVHIGWHDGEGSEVGSEADSLL
jgi:cytochrome c biogenesis protein CcmG, thiol:disulfide interchange protein DsbE